MIVNGILNRVSNFGNFSAWSYSVGGCGFLHVSADLPLSSQERKKGKKPDGKGLVWILDRESRPKTIEWRIYGTFAFHAYTA